MGMIYSETVSTIMHHVSTRSRPRNIRELFNYSSDVLAYNKHFSCAGNFLILQKSGLHLNLKPFPAFGTR